MAKTTDIKFHRDGSVTLWDCYEQRWMRYRTPISNRISATLTDAERVRISRHAERHAAKSEVL